ncbi:protein rexA [Escherichia albertii]|uniref:protein rexA n=2 Tax=Escherichia albertii TaxID=208962 RepID=UPI00183B0B0A|nr:protein rexA [Escherichia albertii]EFF9448219.1 protein rexA [Escherichia coli]EEW3330758.1 protein rexA [Escherichia albertii]EIT7684982.1 protein rexA [Escherichia coli]MCQ8940257.1 protein rexA [Escherichia albertii]MCQ8953587.1 protein rexA [Escherichia albertii]
MKLNFYASYQQNGKERFPIDLVSGLSEQVIKAKNNALEVDDYFIFAHHINRECYLITKTYDSDLVKRVNKTTLSVDEIKNVLGSDETLAFPSFLLIKDGIVGYACTQHGPRIRELEIYLSNKLNITNPFKLCLEPLMRDVTRDDALDMEFIGRTTLRVESGSKLLSPLLRAAGIETIEEELLEGIEITIKPKRMRNISNMSKELIRNADDSHSNIHLKAKEYAADLLTDYYLSSKGHISANIYKSTNEEIAEEMEICYIRMKNVIMKSYKDFCEDE